MPSPPSANPPHNTNVTTPSSTTTIARPSPHQGSLKRPDHATAHNPDTDYWARYIAAVHLRESRNGLRTAIEEDPDLQYDSVAMWWRLYVMDTDYDGKLMGMQARVNVSWLTVKEMEEKKEAKKKEKSKLSREVDIESWEGKAGAGYVKKGNMKQGLVWWKSGR